MTPEGKINSLTEEVVLGSSRDHAPSAGSALEGRHSPGPWRITSDAGHPANIRITSTRRRHIAKVYAESLARDPVCEANAALIAAAPALLNLLIEAMASRAPDYADAAHPGWADRASAMIDALTAPDGE